MKISFFTFIVLISLKGITQTVGTYSFSNNNGIVGVSGDRNTYSNSFNLLVCNFISWVSAATGPSSASDAIVNVNNILESPGNHI